MEQTHSRWDIEFIIVKLIISLSSFLCNSLYLFYWNLIYISLSVSLSHSIRLSSIACLHQILFNLDNSEAIDCVIDSQIDGCNQNCDQCV